MSLTCLEATPPSGLETLLSSPRAVGQGKAALNIVLIEAVSVFILWSLLITCTIPTVAGCGRRLFAFHMLYFIALGQPDLHSLLKS